LKLFVDRKILSIVHIIFLSSLVFGVPTVQAEDSLVEQGIYHGYQFEFTKAEQAFQKLIKQDPKDPKGYFLMTGIFFWKIVYNQEDEVAAEKLRDYAEKAIDIAEDQLDKNEKDPAGMFFLGGAYGALGRYHLMQRNWIRALYYGNKGYRWLNKVVAQDPEYWDAYLGVGMFDFYASVLPSVITAFLETEGDRDKGLEYIALAANKGSLLKAEAQFFQAQMLVFFEQDYVNAEKSLLNFLQRYPGNISANLMLGVCYSRNGSLDKAMVTLESAGEKALARGYKKLWARSAMNIGNVYSMKNDFIRGREQYKLAMDDLEKTSLGRKSGTYAGSYYRYCNNTALIGKVDEAKKCFEQLEDAGIFTSKKAEIWLENPFHMVDIQITEASNFLEVKQPQRALKAFEVIEDKMNGKVEGYPLSRKDRVALGKGRALLDVGNVSASIPYFEQVVKMKEHSDPDLKAWALFFLGRSHRLNGNLVAAKKYLDQAMEEAGFMQEIIIKKEQYALAKDQKNQVKTKAAKNN